MSDGNRPKRTEAVSDPPRWLVVTVMVLMFLGGGALFGEVNELFLGHEYETADQSHYATKCYAVEFPNSAPANKVSSESNKTKTDWGKDYPPYCDLAAQYVAARSAERGAYYGMWALALTAFGVFLLWATLQATRETLDQTEKTTKAIIDEQRPWLSIEEPRIVSMQPVNVAKNKSSGYDEFMVRVSCEVRNRGKMPAHHVTARAGCVPAFCKVDEHPKGYNGAIYDRDIYEINAESHIDKRIRVTSLGHEKTIAPNAHATPDLDFETMQPVRIAKGFSRGTYQYQWKAVFFAAYHDPERQKQFTAWKIFSIRMRSNPFDQEFSDMNLTMDNADQTSMEAFVKSFKLIELKGEMT